MPENLRYAIIRQRHDAGTDASYVPETARILLATMQAAIELIGAGEKEPPGAADARKTVTWFTGHAAPGIERAVAERRKQEQNEGNTE